MHLENVANSVCVNVLQIMQILKNGKSPLLLLIPQKKRSNQNILMFCLTPAEQTVALPAQVWIKSILWMLQTISILLFFTTTEWKVYEMSKEITFMERVAKLLLQRFASDKINEQNRISIPSSLLAKQA